MPPESPERGIQGGGRGPSRPFVTGASQLRTGCPIAASGGESSVPQPARHDDPPVVQSYELGLGHEAEE